MESFKIKNLVFENVFVDDFKELQKYNEIKFDKEIAIVYAPNGTGKTTLTKIFDKENNIPSDISYLDEKNTENVIENMHVIYDQNSRNIIKGEEADFIISSDISKISNLEAKLKSNFNLTMNEVKEVLKSKYKISTVTDKLLLNLSSLQKDLKNLINNKVSNDTISIKSFLQEIDILSVAPLNDSYKNSKYDSIISDYHKKDNYISMVLELKINKIESTKEIREFTEIKEAIKVIQKFDYKKDCLICSHELDSQKLLNEKKERNSVIQKNLAPYLQKEIVNLLQKEITPDSFDINKILLEAITFNKIIEIENLQNEIHKYINYVENSILQDIKNIFEKSTLKKDLAKLESFLDKQVELNDEDILFIEEIISSNLEKNLKITIDRNDNKKLKLTLDGEILLNKERKELKLSNGEQNFISLAFEFMKAKKIPEKIIIIDDPISSFDSIYKNKIIYCINSLTEKKKCLILTHNIDLIKLLNSQKNNCFNLYILNNKEDSDNGFLPVDKKEREILLHLDKLIRLFEKDIFVEIANKKMFLMSMIPFMRGFANIKGDSQNYGLLSEVMHITKKQESVNISKVYKDIFLKNNLLGEKDYFEEDVWINSKDLIELVPNIDVDILAKGTIYSLLNKTLRHTLTYLSLRLNVENTLLPYATPRIQKKFQENKNILLGELIRDTLKDKKECVFFMSRKTLVNDFNHFEGNMDIFQPAMDIKDKALEEEVSKIIDRLDILSSMPQPKEIEIPIKQNI